MKLNPKTVTDRHALKMRINLHLIMAVLVLIYPPLYFIVKIIDFLRG